MASAAGFPDPSEYFNNPERPEELLMAENEILKKITEELKINLENMQNPLAEAETIKAQASLLKATGEQSLKVGQLQQDQRQFSTTTAQKQDQFMKELALKITELEAATGQQIPNNVEQSLVERFRFDPETGTLNPVQ